MKISTPERVAPDETHLLDPALFGDDDRFELSTIRPEDSSIAIEMLIGNYASPMDAVIRELYVNASDSHRAAGQTRPVEITMPTNESPFLVVRDFGLGMSPSDMVNVFTRPAASTKRSENTSTGGLGIGAKSPFTVADRFIVRSNKDGVAATLVMARIDGHLMHLVNEISATDGGNGVEITVPIEVSKIEQWWKALSRVHFWWDKGGARITNAELSPVALPAWTERILENAAAPGAPAAVQNQGARSPMVLMGQIGYKIPDGVLTSFQPLVYVLPVGAVSISPTRESIVATDENREVLKAVLHAWQDEQFHDVATTIMDPTTSMVALGEIERDLRNRHLIGHFDEWVRRERNDEMFAGLLPAYINRTGFSLIYLLHTADNGLRNILHLHAVPHEASARPRSLADLVEVISRGKKSTRLVFVDARTLPDARRRVLTKWAKEQGVVAVYVDRQQLESIDFAAHWKNTALLKTRRPFARSGEIEWIDPDEIRVDRPRAKSAGPAPTGTSLVEVIDMGTHLRRRHETTVDSLVADVKKRANRWVLIDTVAEINKLEVVLPKNIVAVPSGQRPAALLKSRLGARALTVAEFKIKQVEYVERSLTKAQKRSIADATIARVERVAFYFHGATAWIEQTEDPQVRRIASKISSIVSRSLEEYHRSRSARKEGVVATDFIGALETVVDDYDWLVEHSSLGEYAPALFAAQATGLSSRSWRHTTAVVEHIRSTIAAQLVKS